MYTFSEQSVSVGIQIYFCALYLLHGLLREPMRENEKVFCHCTLTTCPWRVTETNAPQI